MAKHASLQITIAHSHGTARTKQDIAKHAAVFPQRDLGFGAAVQVIEHRPGESALRQATQVLDIDDP